MKIQIEKETKWSQHSRKLQTGYYILTDNRCVAYTDSEEEARNIVDEIKSSYQPPTKEFIFDEEI
jgi:hypothetical protein